MYEYNIFSIIVIITRLITEYMHLLKYYNQILVKYEYVKKLKINSINQNNILKY